MKSFDNIISYPLTNLLLWVGAGVSMPEPTSLPSGYELTKFILKIFGNDFQKNIFKIWEKANKIINTPDNSISLGNNPRLESIIGEIDSIKLNSNCNFNLLQGFKLFSDAPFNKNHYYIAKLMSLGATIVTTNFDSCIENAYLNLIDNNNELTLKKVEGIYYYESKNNKNTGKIWHIHGLAKDLKNLGITINFIKSGLNPKFQDFLENYLSKNSILVFIGYSCSDSFDVNLFFLSKNASQFKDSLGVFIQHETNPISYNTTQLLKRFGKYKIEANTNTSEFLSKLSEEKYDIEKKSKTFNWKTSFLKNAKLKDLEKVKDFIICRISNILGININSIKPDAYKNALKFERYFDIADFHETMAITCRIKRQYKKEKYHNLKRETSTLKKPKYDLLGFYYANQWLKKALKYSKNIDELLKDSLDSSKELDWSTYTSMSVHCRIMITKYLKNPFINQISSNDIGIIKKLIELTSLLSKRPLKNVKYINQIMTALRFYSIFQALLNNSNQKDIDFQILYLYSESASSIGLVSAYRDFAIKKFLLAKFYKKINLLSESLSYLNKSLELASLIGDKNGEIRAKKIINILRIYNFFNFILFLDKSNIYNNVF